MKNLFKIISAITLILSVTFVVPTAKAATKTNSTTDKVMWGKVEVKDGVIGKVKVLKDTNVYKVVSMKLKYVKKLKKMKNMRYMVKVK
ncbi:hypothetical protein [Peribacillus sp. NPDC097295]|uniref:hypothetical protein n=1 Tax=Peribacillus sp. NPDC097295 TaxID=3364402 RepID=UPI00381648C9